MHLLRFVNQVRITILAQLIGYFKV